MSYRTVNQCANDPVLAGRVTGCCAKEGASDPPFIAAQLMWKVAAASNIEAAYESALLAENPDPGGDPAVITDLMILSVVQANWPEGV